MSKILKNISLKPFNTFGLAAQAASFTEAHSLADLIEITNTEEFKTGPTLILGGGSNILLTQNFEGLVIKNCLKGISVIAENEQEVILEAGAGESWHDFVMYCVDRNLGGIENLSLIPGTVGAAPMQNIGAYGVEIKDVFHSLSALHISSKELHVFDNAQCQFGYRESVFKHDLKGQYVITAVRFVLQKKPTLKLSYGAIMETLQAKGIEQPGIKEVSDAVISIRRSKLPDPAEIGNSGSFFKNPVIPIAHYEQLKAQYPQIPSYPVDETQVKVPAGWLIEQDGWKGKTIGQIGVHKNQALVLVNYGGGDGNALKKLSEDIQKSIFEKFGINLQVEVNII